MDWTGRDPSAEQPGFGAVDHSSANQAAYQNWVARNPRNDSDLSSTSVFDAMEQCPVAAWCVFELIHITSITPSCFIRQFLPHAAGHVCELPSTCVTLGLESTVSDWLCKEGILNNTKPR